MNSFEKYQIHTRNKVVVSFQVVCDPDHTGEGLNKECEY